MFSCFRLVLKECWWVGLWPYGSLCRMLPSYPCNATAGDATVRCPESFVDSFKFDWHRIAYKCIRDIELPSIHI